MSKSINILLRKIDEYKSKYYKNSLIKGLLLSLGLILTAFLVINFIEYIGRLSSPFRGVLLLIFVGIALYTLVYLIGRPLLYFLKIKQPFSNNEAAKDIGKFFPEISDKLLNTIQLASSTQEENSLLLASIEQKSKKLSVVPFADAINLGENKKYLKYALPPLALLIFISAIVPSFFQSSERIIKFRKEFAQEAPFAFEVVNDNLKAIKNEDYVLKLRLKGDALPEDVFLNYNGRNFKMQPEGDLRNFSFQFNKVQEAIEFNFTAAGFNSDAYEIALVNRPEMLSFDIFVRYPSYLNKDSEKLSNVGNIIIPEGSTIDWRFKTANTDSVILLFNDQKAISLEKSLVKGFNYNKRFKESSEYKVRLQNDEMTNKEEISYFVNVINDQFPKIQLEQIKDTTNYNYVVLGGTISDDYGFSDFKLKYRKNDSEDFIEIPISYNSNQLSQTFFYQFDLFALQLEQEDKIEYFLEVWDNDGVNGQKSTKTSSLSFALPDTKKFNAEIEKQTEDTEKKLEELVKKSKDIQKDLDALDKELKNKKKMDFQEKKKLEDLLKKKQELLKDMKDLQNQLDKLEEKQNRFQEQSPELKKKMDQLQKLLEELMKEDALSKEMEELMEENEEDKIMKQLEKMKQQDRNMDKDLDRTLKLFKNLQLKQKVEKTAKELEKLAEKQEDLAEKTEQNETPEENLKEQEKINEEFEEKKEELKKIEELSKELRKDVDTEKAKQEEISEDQEKATEQMKQEDSGGASKSQKKAGKSMRNLSQALSSMMQTAEMEQMEMDLDALRDILENLIKLSFDQETVMKELRGLDKSDPRYVDVSQQQLKLGDDAKVIEDSLYSLASRVMQMEAFVTKEVTEMKNNMDNSIQLLRDRDVKNANAKQQFSMTSMNNLALMLGDTFQQMQEMMASAMPGSGKGGKGGSMPMPGMGEQQKELNKRMQGLGEKGMGGKELSKELAKLAGEQAKLRKRLQEMQDKLNGTEGGKKIGDQLSELQKQMDQNENDLVNKRIGSQLKNRSKQIETRLLEAEKAIKEQELDPKRKSKTAVEFKRTSPPALDEFMKEKQKQLELIRTTPPNFTPYYKRETDKYFQRIK